MNTLHFQLVTPERKVLNTELVSLSCPTTMGEITILANHAPLVAELKAGELHARTDKEDFYFHVAGGFVQIKPDSQVVVLADAAEHTYEIDEARAKQAKQRAEDLMTKTKQGSPEYAKVSAALERSLSRLNIARKHAHRKNPTSGQGTFSQ